MPRYKVKKKKKHKNVLEALDEQFTEYVAKPICKIVNGLFGLNPVEEPPPVKVNEGNKKEKEVSKDEKPAKEPQKAQEKVEEDEKAQSKKAGEDDGGAAE